VDRRKFLKVATFGAVAGLAGLSGGKEISAEGAKDILAHQDNEPFLPTTPAGLGGGLQYYDDAGSFIKMLPLAYFRGEESFLFCIYPFVKQGLVKVYSGVSYYMRVDYFYEHMPEGANTKEWILAQLENDFNVFLHTWYSEAQYQVEEAKQGQELKYTWGNGPAVLGGHFEQA